MWTPGVFNVTHQLNQNFVPIEYPRGFEPNINLEKEGDGVDQTSREENDLNLTIVNSDLGAVGGVSLSNMNNNNGPPLMGSDHLSNVDINQLNSGKFDFSKSNINESMVNPNVQGKSDIHTLHKIEPSSPSSPEPIIPGFRAVGKMYVHSNKNELVTPTEVYHNGEAPRAPERTSSLEHRPRNAAFRNLDFRGPPARAGTTFRPTPSPRNLPAPSFSRSSSDLMLNQHTNPNGQFPGDGPLLPSKPNQGQNSDTVRPKALIKPEDSSIPNRINVRMTTDRTSNYDMSSDDETRQRHEDRSLQREFSRQIRKVKSDFDDTYGRIANAITAQENRHDDLMQEVTNINRSLEKQDNLAKEITRLNNVRRCLVDSVQNSLDKHDALAREVSEVKRSLNFVEATIKTRQDNQSDMAQNLSTLKREITAIRRDGEDKHRSITEQISNLDYKIIDNKDYLTKEVLGLQKIIREALLATPRVSQTTTLSGPSQPEVPEDVRHHFPRVSQTTTLPGPSQPERPDDVRHHFSRVSQTTTLPGPSQPEIPETTRPSRDPRVSRAMASGPSQMEPHRHVSATRHPRVPSHEDEKEIMAQTLDGDYQYYTVRYDSDGREHYINGDRIQGPLIDHQTYPMKAPSNRSDDRNNPQTVNFQNRSQTSRAHERCCSQNQTSDRNDRRGQGNINSEILRNLPRLDKFNGTSSWDDYVNQFDKMAAIADWSENVKADALHLVLGGVALHYYENLAPEVKHNPIRLRQAMSERFGPDLPAEAQRTAFSNLERKDKESFREFADRVRETALRAYPNAQESEESLMVPAFLRGLGYPEACMHNLNKSHRSLDEALRGVQLYIENEKAIFGKKTKARKVGFEQTEEFEPTINTVSHKPILKNMHEKPQNPVASNAETWAKAMQQLASTLERIDGRLEKLEKPRPPTPVQSSPNRPNSPVTSPRKIICFTCKQPGHIAIKCPAAMEASLNSKETA